MNKSCSLSQAAKTLLNTSPKLLTFGLAFPNENRTSHLSEFIRHGSTLLAPVARGAYASVADQLLHL